MTRPNSGQSSMRVQFSEHQIRPTVLLMAGHSIGWLGPVSRSTIPRALTVPGHLALTFPRSSPSLMSDPPAGLSPLVVRLGAAVGCVQCVTAVPGPFAALSAQKQRTRLTESGLWTGPCYRGFRPRCVPGLLLQEATGPDHLSFPPETLGWLRANLSQELSFRDEVKFCHACLKSHGG